MSKFTKTFDRVVKARLKNNPLKKKVRPTITLRRPDAEKRRFLYG